MHDIYRIEIYFDRNVYNCEVISTDVRVGVFEVL